MQFEVNKSRSQLLQVVGVDSGCVMTQVLFSRCTQPGMGGVRGAQGETHKVQPG